MHTCIIAEAGVNHNGYVELAKKLIDVASCAGADFVKFQTFKSENLVTAEAPKAKYQNDNTKDNESQFEMLKKLELTYDEFEILFNYCKEKGIGFLSTPFDIESAEFLSSLGMDIWKIPSGEITNLPLLEYIGGKKEKIILSTGMSDFEEVNAALTVLRGAGADDITLLHCTTQYPAPYESVNLKAMCELRERFHTKVGYSDHTLGSEVSVAAVALGASVIEKHFTLDKNMDGPDHKASMEPDELTELVKAIRHIDVAIGDGRKIVQDVESDNKKVARKSIIVATHIDKGTIITREMLCIKRPGTGISPMKINQIIGTKAIRDFEKDELLEI